MQPLKTRKRILVFSSFLAWKVSQNVGSLVIFHWIPRFLAHCLPPSFSISLFLPVLQTLQCAADPLVSGQLWFLRETCGWSSHLVWSAQFWPKLFWALTLHDWPHQMLLFTCPMTHGSIRLFRPPINPAWKKSPNHTRTPARNESWLLSCCCLTVT